MVNWTYQFFLNAQIITDFGRIAPRLLFTFLYYIAAVHMPEIFYFATELISDSPPRLSLPRYNKEPETRAKSNQP